MGSSLRSGRDCRWGEWITSTLSTFNTTTEVRPLSKAPNPQLLPGRRNIGCPLLQVCVHYCVCALGWVKCRAQIPSMGHHTWPHTTSLSPFLSLKLIKSDDKYIYNVTTDFYFQINAVLLNFLFIKETWKKFYSVVFNIIIINIFEQQIRILEWFLKDHVTGIMMLKIQLWNHRNKLHFKIYSNRKHSF